MAIKRFQSKTIWIYLPVYDVIYMSVTCVCRFLFENQSPAHVYYRWKLYSILQVSISTHTHPCDVTECEQRLNSVWNVTHREILQLNGGRTISDYLRTVRCGGHLLWTHTFTAHHRRRRTKRMRRKKELRKDHWKTSKIHHTPEGRKKKQKEESFH